MTSAAHPVRTLNRDGIRILFAHAAYRLADRFALRNTGLEHQQVSTLEDLAARVHEADVLVVSGLWRNELIAAAPRLAFIQSVSAGTDQYSRDALRAAGIRASSAQGVNERAVAEHAMALILAIMRRIPEARINQSAKRWRPMIGDLDLREDELGGKTIAIIGMGRIGSRLATLARAFDMRVIGVKRDVTQGTTVADRVLPQSALHEALREADFVVLTCPLTPETENLIDVRALSSMKATAYLVNVARGRVVDERALIAALNIGTIAGAALDTVRDEPLPVTSPLWSLPNVLITPHSAGETRRYEDNVIDLLVENLERIGRGEATLRNQFV